MSLLSLAKELQMMEGDKPAIGFIYEAINQAKEVIKATYMHKTQKSLPSWKIIDERWNRHIHRVANHYLDHGTIIQKTLKRMVRKKKDCTNA